MVTAISRTARIDVRTPVRATGVLHIVVSVL
jgi:hypothetical protein